jgi:flagellar FliL protein
MSDTPAPSDPAAPAKKSRGKLIPIVVAVLVLGGAGGGAYWYFVARPAALAASGGEAVHAEAAPEPTGVVTLEPFVVNLADPGGTRFLRVSLALVVKSEEEAAELGENPVVTGRIRSSLIELLAQQTSSVLVTPEGKAALKKAITAEVAHAAHEAEVSDVLFSEFVVQF